MVQPVLTAHVRRRILERISMTDGEILDALARGKGIPVGYDPRDRKVRYVLLYSIPDDFPFLVVQNEVDGGTITIYSCADSGKIKRFSPEAYRMARKAALGESIQPTVDWSKAFRVWTRIEKLSGRRMTQLKLEPIPSELYGGSIETLREDAAALSRIREEIRGKFNCKKPHRVIIFVDPCGARESQHLADYTEGV